MLKVTAHATAPLNAHPNFRQYDFFVDGMSFYSMPKVYRLGLTDNTPIQDHGTLALAHSSRVSGGYSNYSTPAYGQRISTAPPRSSIVELEAPHNADEEEAYLKEAIKASLSEVSNKEGDINVNSTSSYAPQPPSSSAPDLLIDFMSEPGPVPAPAPSATNNNMLTAFTGTTQYSPYAIQQPAAAPSFAAPPVSNTPVPLSYADPFAPPPAVPKPMSAGPSMQSTFNAPPPAPQGNQFSNPFAQPPPPVAPAAPFEQPPPVPEQAPALSNPQLTMAPKQTGLGSDAFDAYSKFANMDQFDLVKPKVQAQNPFDAPVSAKAAPAPTSLAQMKAMNDQSTGKKEVMKNSNAMVMSGNQTGNWGGYNNYGAQMAPNNYGMMQGQPQQPMMNQGYGYPQQQQQFGGAPMYQQYGQPMQQQQQQQPPMQQQAYGQNQFQGHGQQQF